MLLHLAREYGGFRNRRMVEFFVKFRDVCINRYKDKVKYWVTFNEINNQMDVTNPIFLWTNSGVVVKERENAKEVMYQAESNQFTTLILMKERSSRCIVIIVKLIVLIIILPNYT